MQKYFPDISRIPFANENSHEILSYRYYNPQQELFGKTMAEHLRLAVCFWHTFGWEGNDNFGMPNFQRSWLRSTDPMERAANKVHAAFEFIEKLGLPFFTFHDRDIAPEGRNLKESNENLKKISEIVATEMQQTGIQLLWGTANLFSHPRYIAGAATNPNPEIFAYAVAQVKAAFDITQQLNGSNYVLWGGREGYETLLNTNLKQELDQLGRFLSMLVDYKNKVGFKGLLLIEPKPCEPTKHQYDHDTATVYAFLQKYGLEKEFKVNIEANHATLAGHSFVHEITYAFANDIFGSIDANRGDPQLGWDTDQFPNNLNDITEALYVILQNGGFTTGGFNFDAKVRRQSIDPVDLFYGHICGVDTLARCLLNAAELVEQKKLENFTAHRYEGWQEEFGQNILIGHEDFDSINQHVLNSKEPEIKSGRQEMLEILVNSAIRER